MAEDADADADDGPAGRGRRAGTIGRWRLAMSSAVLCAALLLVGCDAGGPPGPAGETSAPAGSPSQSGKDQQVDDLTQCLVGRWTHSQEEDAAQTNVFRPASYAFPPARGRTGYEFHSDGRLTYYGIAAGDGSEELAGSWRAQGPHTVSIIVDGRPETAVWDISSCDQDKLVVKV